MIYVEGVDFMTPAELAEADDRARLRRSAKQRELVALRAASPMRPVAVPPRFIRASSPKSVGMALCISFATWFIWSPKPSPKPCAMFSPSPAKSVEGL
mgnify:CR=1 FL=1